MASCGRTVHEPSPATRASAGKIETASVVALVAVGVLVVRALLGGWTTPTPVTPYQEPLWWLDYASGFVRRGLPGEVLSWVTGGTPSREAALDAARLLSLTAVVALLPLASTAARRAGAPTGALLVTLAVLASPLTVGLLAHDVGRYDAVGVIALGLLVLDRFWQGLPLPAVAVGAGSLVLVATASEEFLVVFVAPAAAVRLLRHVPSARLLPPASLLAVTVGPGLMLAVASSVVPVPAELVDRTRAEAQEAGAPVPGPMGDAVQAIGRDLVENLQFFSLFSPISLALSFVLWAVVGLSTLFVLATLLQVSGKRAVLLAVYFAVIACGLSAVGVDFRRWWALAVLGFLALVLSLPDRHAAVPPGASVTPRRRPALLVTLAVLTALGLGSLAWEMPVYPISGVTR